MPFDPVGLEETYPLIPGPEGLRVLARALRAPMPEGFKWDFCVGFATEFCGVVGCAMGLGMHLWGFRHENHESSTQLIERIFKIPESDARGLFILAGHQHYSSITPPMVADAIDRYLDTGEIWPEDLRP